MRHLKTVKKRGHNKIIDGGTGTLFEGEKKKARSIFHLYISIYNEYIRYINVKNKYIQLLEKNSEL